MSDVIDIKRFQKKRKAENFKSAEEMTRERKNDFLIVIFQLMIHTFSKILHWLLNLSMRRYLSIME
jgi:hypothetical protein